MASFGSFETDRELDSGPNFTDYSARKAGEARADYLLKIFHILPGEAFGEATAELDPLLADLQRASQQRIALQQQAAEASPFVARVEESGHDDRGVWYVTRLQPRSVSKIISGRVALNRNALHHILHATASGALAFKQVCGRSHGEILPGDIFIGRSEKVEQAEVLLADPLPGDASSAAQYEAADLRAVGKILLQLVRQREITDEDDFHILPILTSPEWTNLFGKDTEQWLALCNRLLDPNLTAGQYTLEQLVQDLEALRAKPAVPRGVLIGGGVAVLLLLAGGCFAWFHFKRGGVAVVSEPPGADIKLEAGGQTRTLGKAPLVAKGLDKGEVRLMAELPGLAAQTNAVVIAGGKTVSSTFTFECGQVKLVTSPEGATVELEGEAVGKTIYTSPWLPPGTNTYVLRLEGHLGAKIEVAILANRQTHEVRTVLVPLKKDERSVAFESDPAGATIQVQGNGTNVTIKSGDSLPLSYGSYKATATLQDWSPVVSNLVVAAGGGDPKLKFVFPYGRVLFSIEPEDAELVLNDQPFKLEYRQRKMQPRDYTLRASKPGFHPFETAFSVRVGGENEVVTNVVVKLKPMHGSVAFASIPPGATVEITDTRQPGQPFARIPNVSTFTTNLPPASYAFLARHDGLKLDPVSAGPVFVPIGTNIPLPFRFTFGTVEFRSDPAGASVTIGNQSFPTPYTHRQKPGEVAYRVELEYYQPEEGTRPVAAGATVELNFPLRPRAVDLGLTGVPDGVRFSVSNTPLNVVGGRVSLPWGTKVITATLPTMPSLPGWEPQSKIVEVAKDGSTKASFSFPYATLNLTNAESEAKLYYRDRSGTNLVTNFPARFPVRPDFQYEFVVEYGPEFRTNLSVKLAANTIYTPPLVLPELRRNVTNSIGMVLGHVNRQLYVGVFEVTEEEFSRVMGKPPEVAPRLPKSLVPWQSAAEFCQKLTEMDKPFLEAQKLRGWVYTLPTEDEWKQCAGKDPDQLTEAVFSQVSRNPQEINWARKSLNRGGFYDLFGNVAEWCDSKATLGGSCFDRLNRTQIPQMFVGFMRVDSSLLQPTVPTGPIMNGAPNIGFRCALRATTR